MRRRGWFGDSRGHAMAARGIKLYAKKEMVDPMFYFNQREQEIPLSHIQQMIDQGYSFEDMKRMHPDADHSDMRRRAIKVLDGRSGSGTLSDLDSMGVDAIVKASRVNPRLGDNAAKVLQDEQKASFIPEPKRLILREKLMVGAS